MLFDHPQYMLDNSSNLRCSFATYFSHDRSYCQTVLLFTSVGFHFPVFEIAFKFKKGKPHIDVTITFTINKMHEQKKRAFSTFE